MPIRIKNINYESCLNRTVQTSVPKPVKRVRGIIVDLTTKPDVFKSEISDLLSRSKEEILSVVKETVKKNNPFQFGAESSIYKIPETQYAVQIPHGKTIGNYASVSFDLTEKESINHLVAKLGNKIYIKRFVEGLTTRAPYTEKVTPFGVISDVDEIAQNKVNEHVKNLTPLSFEKLYNQIFKAINNDMAYDCYGENLILNPKNRTLTAIDFDPMEREYKFNPVAEIYHSFSINDDNEQKILLNKIITGFVKSITNKNCTLKDFSRLEISEFCDRYNLYKDFKDKKHLTKINNTLYEILKNCKSLRQTEA